MGSSGGFLRLKCVNVGQSRTEWGWRRVEDFREAMIFLISLTIKTNLAVTDNPR